MEKVLIDNQNPETRDLYRRKAPSYGLEPVFLDGRVQQQAEALLAGCRALIAKGGRDVLDLDFLRQHGIIYVSLFSTGYDTVDVAKAVRLGVHVANNRAYSPNAIADVAVALGMTLLRGLAPLSLAVSRGDFRQPASEAREVRDCTVGILGCGAIGSTVAAYYRAMGARIVGFDKYPRQDAGIEYLPLAEVLKQSDIISIHLPYFPDQNYHLIDEQALKLVKPQTVIVNAARGELVDLAAVEQAVADGRLQGYGCDVFENEVSFIGKTVDTIDDPVIRRAAELYPRILMTPHMGSHTARARENQVDIALRNIAEFVETGQSRNEVTK